MASDSVEIPKIIGNYVEKLYSNKMENLNEMDRLLHTYELPRLNQEDIKILNNLILGNKIKVVITLPTKKSPCLGRFTAKFYKYFIEDLMSILFKLFNKIERKIPLL